MAESNSAIVVSTAVAALVLSLSSAGYGIYRAALGPDVVLFSPEDALLFAYADGSPEGELGATMLFDLANTSPEYPDILVSQALRVMRDGKQVACLGERGVTVLEQTAPAPAAAVSSISAVEAAGRPVTSEPMFPGGSSEGAVHSTHQVEGAAETIQLKDMRIGVLDRPSRTELRAGELLSRRQLFDQRATLSVVDPCYDPAMPKNYTVEQLLADFPPGKDVVLLYEARFVESIGLNASCSFDITQSRANILKTRGYLVAPCGSSSVAPVAGEGLFSGFLRFWNRIF